MIYSNAEVGNTHGIRSLTIPAINSLDGQKRGMGRDGPTYL